MLAKVERHLPWAGHLLQQDLLYLRVADKGSRPDEPDTLHQLVAGGAFQQVATGAGSEQLHHMLHLVGVGQYTTTATSGRSVLIRLVASIASRLGRRASMRTISGGFELPGLADRLAAVCRFANYLEVGFLLQDSPANSPGSSMNT